MPNHHANAALARRSWNAVAEADTQTLREVWAEDIIWHVTDDNQWNGDHVGQDAVLEYLAQVGEFGLAYQSTLEEVMASETRAMIMCHVESKRTGRELSTDYGLLCRIEDDRIVEVWTLPLDRRATTRFWAD